jgi:hypothetical protein
MVVGSPPGRVVVYVWRISLDDVGTSVEDCSLLVGAEVVDSLEDVDDTVSLVIEI